MSWIETFDIGAKSVAALFAHRLELTAEAPTRIDENYWNLKLLDLEDNQVCYAKVHQLTIGEIVRFKKQNPKKPFVLTLAKDTLSGRTIVKVTSE